MVTVDDTGPVSEGIEYVVFVTGDARAGFV